MDTSISSAETLSIFTSHPDTERMPRATAPPGYTLKETMDITRSRGAGGSGRHDAAWVTALRDESYFPPAHTLLYTEALPITIEDISNLYRRQIREGQPERLEHIEAGGILPWGMADFRTLSGVALSSLNQLSLVAEASEAGSFPPSSSLVSFADLPEMITTIRRDLPNLKTLSFCMKDLDAAEPSTQAALSPDGLDGCGPLEMLEIRTVEHAPPLFNTVRALSPICRSDVNIRIGPPDQDYTVLAVVDPEQTRFLQSLRQKPRTIRSYLATLDFATVGVVTWADYQALQYHPETGEPEHLYRSGAKKWYASAQPNIEESSTKRAPSLLKRLAEFGEDADRYVTRSTTGTSAEMLGEAEKLLAIGRSMQEDAEILSRAISRTVAPLERYVASLRSVTSHGDGPELS